MQVYIHEGYVRPCDRTFADKPFSIEVEWLNDFGTGERAWVRLVSANDGIAIEVKPERYQEFAAAFQGVADKLRALVPEVPAVASLGPDPADPEALAAANVAPHEDCGIARSEA